MYVGKKGFTLIELLIVVAIIAILAAIAVPNFLEAQVRSKVARVHNDLRSFATAIESYTVDNNRELMGMPEYSWVPGGEGFPFRFHVYYFLTTPIAYMTSILKDPFANRFDDPMRQEEAEHYYLDGTYVNDVYPAWWGDSCAYGRSKGYTWCIYSIGPDKIPTEPWFVFMFPGGVNSSVSIEAQIGNIYDSSNGTLSFGEIYRTNKGITKGLME